jgi:hypothetical protein
MDRHCPRCNLPVGGQLRCPLCDASLVRVNLRRTLLWALVVEEYLFVIAMMLRLRLG